MNKEIDSDVLEHVAEFLPEAIAKAVESYHSFSEQDIPEDSKGFTSHHNACKVAISHVELLLKLARSIGMEEGKNASNQELDRILEGARLDLENYEIETGKKPAKEKEKSQEVPENG